MKKLSYGRHRDQFGHLHLPETGKDFAVMVVIHGGYWKDNHSLESYATNALVGHFKDSGVAVWNLEYRRMNAEGENQAAPWPATFEDVAAGIDFLRSIAVSESLDLGRVLLVGHSAGGHLAAWAASRRSIPRSSPLFSSDPLMPARIVAISAILDISEERDLSQPQQVQRLIGGSQEDYPERFAAANPLQLTTNSSPITLVHGKSDDDVSIRQAEAYERESINPNLRLVRIPNAGHFGMLPLEGAEPPGWRQLLQVLADELDHLDASGTIDPEHTREEEGRGKSGIEL